MLAWGRDTAGIAIWIAVCFVSILVHEMGHALVIKRFGGTPSVLLYPGGGLTFGKSEITGVGKFSGVYDIREILGDYVNAEAHAGAVRSARSTVMYSRVIGTGGW